MNTKTKQKKNGGKHCIERGQNIPSNCSDQMSQKESIQICWTLLNTMIQLRLTNTSESLCPVVVSHSNHQWEEMDLTEPSHGAFNQATCTADWTTNGTTA